jgi:hypothetical protein
VDYKGYGEVLSLRPSSKQITHPVLQEAYSFFMRMLDPERKEEIVEVLKG